MNIICLEDLRSIYPLQRTRPKRPQVNSQFHVTSFLICISGYCPPSFRREREREGRKHIDHASDHVSSYPEVVKKISSRLFFCQNSLSLFDFIFEAKLLPFGDS